MYECLTAAGNVPDAVKSQVAKEITRIHCEATGAPPLFVHVMFPELPHGAHYTAGKIDTHATIIRGGIRAGRSLESRQKIMKAISESWCRLTGQKDGDLMITLQDEDAAHVMEFGLILSQPGEEDAWFESNRAHLTEVKPDVMKDR